MASPALGQGFPQPAGPQSDPETDKQQQPETTATTPAPGSIEDRKKAFQLDADDEKNILKLIRDYKQDWSIARRQAIRKSLRHIEYCKNNQYICWDPFNSSYKPFASLSTGAGVTQGSEQSTDSVQYQSPVNIIQWLDRVYCSKIGANVPDVEWWPGDSESDIDNRAALARGRAYQKISSDNRVKDFLDQALSHFFLTGGWFRHIRWSMDKTVTGTHYEDIYGWQDTPLSPDRYSCPDCGADTPANVQSIDVTGRQQTPCVGCGKPLGSANFYPAVTVQMPVVTGQKEVPNGQVRWDCYNLLNVEVMPTANTNGPGVIGNTPILDLAVDITKGAFRKMYPDPSTWKMAGATQTDSSSSDSELARMARQQTLSPGDFRINSASPNIVTHHRVWLTPEAINSLDDMKAAQKLADKIGEGCVVAIVNDKIVDIQTAVLRKEWTSCQARKNVGAYPPAPVEVAMPFQDRINDRTNSVDEFHDRCGNPPILFNDSQIDKAFNGKFLPAGVLTGVPVNADIGQDLQKAFWQPTFKMDNGIYEWIQQLFNYVQLLVGIVPQTYGGSDSNIKTATGQEQALKSALEILWLTWNAVRGEFTDAANLSVDCFAANATKDEYDVVKSDDSPDFENEPIRLTDLSGKAVAKAEANQDYPISYDQQRELFMTMLGLTDGKAPSPLVMEMLDTFENRRLMIRLVGTPDMELPETPARNKVLLDIQLLVQGAPTEMQVMGQDPQTGMPTPQTIQKPSVEPDPDFDDFDVTIETVVRYVRKHYDRLKGTPGLENLRSYLAMTIQFKQQKDVQAQAAQQLLNPPPPDDGSGGAPATPAAQ